MYIKTWGLKAWHSAGMEDGRPAVHCHAAGSRGWALYNGAGNSAAGSQGIPG